MATVVNNAGGTGTDSGGNNVSALAGVIVLLLLAILFVFYGLPLLRGAGTSTAPQINVPNNFDVNVNQGKGK